MRLTAMEEPRQGTRGLRLGLALAAGLAVSACATAGGGAGSGPGIVRFYNTTDACTGVLPLTVALGSATWPVPPGGDVAITIPAGVHVAEVHARGDLLERHTWEVGAGAVVEDFVGCAAPELTRAGEGRARVRLELPAAGCAPGLHGPVSVSLGGRPAGRVGRGEAVARWLPVGVGAVDVDGRSLAVAVPPAGGGAAEVARVALDCEPDAVLGAEGVWPLVVLGPPLGCGPTAAVVHARAAGLEATVGPGEAWTVYVPTGRHQVAVAVGDEPARSEVVEVGGGPAVLAPGAAACDGRGLSAGGAADTVRP